MHEMININIRATIVKIMFYSRTTWVPPAVGWIKVNVDAAVIEYHNNYVRNKYFS